MKLTPHVLALCVTAAMSGTAIADGKAPAAPAVRLTCAADCAAPAAPPLAQDRQSGALMLGGLGAIGFVAHRRRARSGGRG